MAQSQTTWATSVAGACRAHCAAFALVALLTPAAWSKEAEEPIVAPPPEFAGRSVGAATEPSDGGPSNKEFLDPGAAKFDAWESIVGEDGVECDDKPPLRPFDWMRHWGFHHSSTEGRYLDRGVPLEYSSWLNRPYHADFFVGPMLMDDTDGDRVHQANDLFGGLRLGWDFDYYWGLEWRIGWSDPKMYVDGADEELDGNLMLTDIDFIYYPWGDTRVRPYFQAGIGAAEIGTVRADGQGQEVFLLTMPFGVGVQFPFTHWLAGRLEILDNLAFGNDGVNTMNNISFTAGLEMRLGARPNSYWPWRSSRNIW